MGIASGFLRIISIIEYVQIKIKGEQAPDL
jgi:hypothetical protein